jgi:hypothetical protein
MTRMPAEEWPSFQSPLLESVSVAFRGRRKALRHRMKSLAVSREVESSPAEPHERLNVDGMTHEAKPTQVRLSFGRTVLCGSAFASRLSKAGLSSSHFMVSFARPRQVIC